MHVSEGPGSTPDIPSKADPQSKFPRDFLLNPGWNPVPSHEHFGKSKQPTLNIPSGSQVHIWHLKATGDSLYASLPLFHKEKVNGCHHPYSSKPRNADASSSREKNVDEEDENMSQTQSETNDEPRGDNFMVHEQGT
ncbi:hypothetical protein O181_040669 [Austropuccinia psidii MF-1]|uniref:Uncharacterized protein n=1 Tax=Austropuccinia psidii MF-1 TaxID=1389203 RepID=A0A9Q3DCW8_9BASI|nr:hypothetical protein [Austropuccinia psidii MF-1]